MSAKTPDDYLKEMMALYNQSNYKSETSSVSKKNSETDQIAVPIPESIPKAEPISISEPIKDATPLSITEPIPEPVKIPEPELIPTPIPLLKLPSEDDIESNESVIDPEETSFGWIQVSARTAGNALPLEGVSVLILKERGMDTDLIMSLVTDKSGNTPTVKLPAPPIGNAKSQPYSTYQIRAFLPGYTRMESASVPVFSGVTSIQPFELIPLPVGSDGNNSTIINQNTEPKF